METQIDIINIRIFNRYGLRDTKNAAKIMLFPISI